MKVPSEVWRLAGSLIFDMRRRGTLGRMAVQDALHVATAVCQHFFFNTKGAP
jgi:hypothetical protein